jgi:hypothetical protein
MCGNPLDGLETVSKKPDRNIQNYSNHPDGFLQVNLKPVF